MKAKRFSVILVLALLALLSGAAAAPTPLYAYRATTDRWHQEVICEATNGNCYYVSTTGDDSDDGSFGYPFATIQHGIDTMQPGDYLYLRGGVYGEHSISLWGKQGSEDAWFTVKSYPGEWAIVDGGHPEDDSGVNIFRSSSHNLYAPIYWRFEYF